MVVYGIVFVFQSQMKLRCPNPVCTNHSLKHRTPWVRRSIIRSGFFFRKSDSKRIERFKCRLCDRNFSRSTHHPAYYQKRRRINAVLSRLLCSGVSQRGAAVLLGVNRKTVVRRFRYLAQEAKVKHERELRRLAPASIDSVQFDDLESAEHTKCKPLSVALAVDAKTRWIFGFQVSQMPAKGHLSAISKKKYGKRADHRNQGWQLLFQRLKPFVKDTATFSSDENPHYPRFLNRYFPEAAHQAHPGKRGCVSGQGELKKIGFDPLFSLNHTCAMLRARLSRLFRRTWCLSKNLKGLQDHLDLYVRFHNQHLVHHPHS